MEEHLQVIQDGGLHIVGLIDDDDGSDALLYRQAVDFDLDRAEVVRLPVAQDAPSSTIREL